MNGTDNMRSIFLYIARCGEILFIRSSFKIRYSHICNKQKDENFTNCRSHDIVLDNYRIYRRIFEISFSHICSKQKDESITNGR